ncbi:MAG TPA: hypothetical protein H9948_06080 [Candidatus Jeotgalibaca merdavium]|uniref:Uncharacterized protein n=1 Tax=Candidatus Jeotgalibaca merdavium TaxID=2838627 RepID=A0A9D2KYE4_9LACT|nr:hypothetical protein [Candidatus Jeotgalibaca merdavium]
MNKVKYMGVFLMAMLGARLAIIGVEDYTILEGIMKSVFIVLLAVIGAHFLEKADK